MNRSQSQSHATSPNPFEPLAIVGLGCRFPGNANSWQSYWEILNKGVDAIVETPATRWNNQKFYVSNDTLPGKTQSKWGGFVEDIEQFDPQLFGISPREAASMDPQQRMLLEVAFRAFEDGGQRLDQIAGQAVSVFVGISSFDYAVAGLSYQDRGVIDAYSNTGGSSSIAANRISYCFDLRGPSVAVDTACSSSLVAVHMACESIWRGDATMALAGGVNALILPDFYVAFSQLGVLSPDGRCKTFDSRANGYVRSEGAGMVLLKPLGDALRDKDNVYAVIRATALNQDGRTPGMTVPSQEAQRSLIQAACTKAGVSPSAIQYVEAHGTGTPVGDPLEAGALGEAIGQSKSKQEPCWVGSVKTNIGHLEAGAGIASLIKVALSLYHRTIPAHLHFHNPNPAIDFQSLNLRVPTESVAWESVGPRLAGINGFGYGGANAHVILEEAPTVGGNPSSHISTSGERVSDEGLTPPVLLPLSARSREALASVASDMANWLEHKGSELHLAEVAGYIAHRRSHYGTRSSVCGASRAEIIDQLRTLASSTREEQSEEISASKLAKGVAFVCSGQGPQWWAMGRGLLQYSPAFRSVIKRCDAEFRKYGNWSLVEELSRSEHESRMQQTSIAQPSIFAIQVAMAALWESWGIKPTTLVGHSVGEIASAYLSGALEWNDACCVAFHRGRTMDLASSQGAMVAAGLSAAEVPQWLSGIEADVSLAAINGPSSVTISGAAIAIETLVQRLDQAGVFCRRLAVEYAFHSPQMEPVRDELLESLAHIRPRPTHTSLISTVTGRIIEGEKLDAEYWWQNVRNSVRFSDAMTELAKLDYGVVVEIGPHPVLAYSINECFQAVGKSVRSVPSLNRQQDDLLCISKSLGSLYSLGFDIDWSGFYNRPQRKLVIPAYPFQSQRCWSESPESEWTRSMAPVHPLLGEAINAPAPTWQQRIDLKLQKYLSDHRVRGACVYPAAAIIEAAIAAALEVGGQKKCNLSRFRLHKPCVLAENRPQWIESRYDAGLRQLQLMQRECDSQEWMPLATVGFRTEPTVAPERSQFDIAKSRCTEFFDARRLYEYCRELGLEYGPQFRGGVMGQRGDGEAVLEVDLPKEVSAEGYHFSPALLDSCFHAMIAADRNFDDVLDGLYLPSEIREIIFHKSPGAKATVHARLLSKTKKLMVCDLDIFDSSGELCMSIRQFESRRVHGGRAAESTEDLIYGYEWIEQPIPQERSASNTQRWVVFMDEGRVGRELCQRMRQRGDLVVEVYRDDSQVAKSGMSGFQQLSPQDAKGFDSLLRPVARSSEPLGIVYLWGLDAPPAEALTAGNLRESTVLTTLAPMYLVQAWERMESKTDVQLAIVTAGAQSQDFALELTEVAQSPLIGFARVVASELGAFRTQLVDLPSNVVPSDIDHLWSELTTASDEDEILWRGQERYVRRFGPQAGRSASTDALQSLPCQLRIGASASIEDLRYETRPLRELSKGQVEIKVQAAGLNFSDVMKALDLYPGLPDGPVALGAECSGVIVRAAEGSQWRVGDEVMAVAPGAFASHVVVDEALVARKPSCLTHEQAATIPIAFLTAEYALNNCARLQEGESVLIHSASGGVGLAAMQLAKLAGVRVLATAGSDEKREYVRKQGASCVMNSRTLEFGSETLRETGGQGVDAVLNSLPGEAITTGLSVLRTGGRFLEIGKRDIYGDTPLSLYPFRNNLSLYAIDLDQLFKASPQIMGNMLRSLSERFEVGELQPLPVHLYQADEIREAFRLMQQGKHIGKVVVSYAMKPTCVQNGEFVPLRLRENGTYWVAGGMGGFGLEVARWLVRRGAKTLVLSGRSTTPRSEVLQFVEHSRSVGVDVQLAPCDITKPGDVQRVMSQIDASLPPLRGVVHTAMILEDKLLLDLDRETLERVLWPKVLGGWNLHQATRARELDLFVLFSSLSSVFGHAGQANYSAANALLDSLAYYRRAQGLPGLVLNWGHLGEVGYLAQREQLGQRLERQGVLSFTVKQATDCLEYAIQHRAVQQSVLRIDWSVWRGLGITGRVSPRFAHLLKHRVETMETVKLSAAGLRDAGEAERAKMLDQMLRSKVAQLLGIPPEQIYADRALLEMGLDSLMAVELRNWIESQVEVSLQISSLMRSESFEQLVQHLSGLLSSTQGVSSNIVRIESSSPSSPRLAEENAAELLDQLSDLDDAEVSELLGQILRESN